jgi:hypothetical protein
MVCSFTMHHPPLGLEYLLNSDSLKGSSVKVITYLWMVCFGFTWKPYAANLPRGDLKLLIAKIACLAIVCSFRT